AARAAAAAPAPAGSVQQVPPALPGRLPDLTRHVDRGELLLALPRASGVDQRARVGEVPRHLPIGRGSDWIHLHGGLASRRRARRGQGPLTGGAAPSVARPCGWV